jgi:hypothetical protein
MQSQVFLYVDIAKELSSAAGVRTQLTARASLGEKTSMSFFRHEEIYRSDVSPGYSGERQLNVAAPVLIGCDEFPVGYSLAGCPPAEPASASPTSDDSQQSTNQQQQQNQEQQQNQNQEQNQGRLHRRLDTPRKNLGQRPLSFNTEFGKPASGFEEICPRCRQR